jgi:hypothetical protein
LVVLHMCPFPIRQKSLAVASLGWCDVKSSAEPRPYIERPMDGVAKT